VRIRAHRRSESMRSQIREGGLEGVEGGSGLDHR
jgi:hypothetical protein